MDITVLELHLPEAEFNAPFSRDSSDGAESRAGRSIPRDESTEGGRSGIAAIAVLIGLAAVAWYLRSSRGGEEVEAPPASTRRVA